MTRRAVPIVAALLVMQATLVVGTEQFVITPAGKDHADLPASIEYAQQLEAVDDDSNSTVGSRHLVESEDAKSSDTAPRTDSTALSESQAAPPPDVVLDIRTLYSLQDAAAAGHVEAGTLQQAMLQQIDRKLAAGLPEGEQNVLVQNIVGFVLSGGNPSVADHLAERDNLSALQRKLLRGASLYMRGKREEASGLLAKVNALLLRPSIAGRVALVQAVLETGDGERRQALLAVAIASMPGSLVEESALRRSALFYAMKGNQHMFWKRANRYLRRFPHSIYVKPFLQDVMNSILKLGNEKAVPEGIQIDIFLIQIPQSMRRSFYLNLARQAALRNLVDLTRFASRRSLRLSVPGSQEAQVAGLYGLIFEVTSAGPVDDDQGLRNLNPELLPPLERRILEAGLKVVDAIRRPVAASSTGTSLLDSGEEDLGLKKTAELSLAGADRSIEESSR